MADQAAGLDCLHYAARWRQRVQQTDRPELRVAYARIADSYEALSRQSHLCRRLVAAIASQRGEAPRCCCGGLDAAASLLPADPVMAE